MASSSAIPPTMTAFQQVRYSRVATEVVERRVIPTPRPSKPEDVLVRIKASAWSFGDMALGTGLGKAIINVKFPTVVGRDFSGIVEEIFPGSTTTLRVGDKVVGEAPFDKGEGSFAEFLVITAPKLAKVPPSAEAKLSLAELATFPVSSVTTYGALVEKGVLKRGAGQSILILGGSSATGLAAIQLARDFGCSRIVVTSTQEALCRSVGATEVIDYRTGAPWWEQLKGANFDILYDTVEGLPAWRHATPVLKSSGATFVSIVMDSPVDDATICGTAVFVGRLISRKFWGLFGYPNYIWHINVNSKGLPEILELAGQGRYRAIIDGEPFDNSMASFVTMWDKQIARRAHGKMVMLW